MNGLPVTANIAVSDGMFLDVPHFFIDATLFVDGKPVVFATHAPTMLGALSNFAEWYNRRVELTRKHNAIFDQEQQ